MWNLSVLLTDTRSKSYYRERALNTLKLLDQTDPQITASNTAPQLIGLLEPLTFRRERLTSPYDTLCERDRWVALQPKPTAAAQSEAKQRVAGAFTAAPSAAAIAAMATGASAASSHVSKK